MQFRQTKSNNDKPSFFGKPEERRSCCSCQFLFIVFVAALFLILGGLWWFIYQAKQKVNLPSAFVYSESVNIAGKIDEAIAGKESETSIFLSEKEVSQLIGAGTGNETLVGKIEPEGITLYGQFNSLKGTTAVVEAEPEIKDNKLVLKVTKLYASAARLPGFLTFLVSRKLAGFVLIDGAKSGKIELTECALQSGGIKIHAKVVGR